MWKSPQNILLYCNRQITEPNSRVTTWNYSTENRIFWRCIPDMNTCICVYDISISVSEVEALLKTHSSEEDDTRTQFVLWHRHLNSFFYTVTIILRRKHVWSNKRKETFIKAQRAFSTTWNACILPEGLCNPLVFYSQYKFLLFI